MKSIDYLIVGQGIAGTVLSYLLLQRGKQVLVVDKYYSRSASRNAGAVINPVTGRKTVKTWRIDELLPIAKHTYKAMQGLLGTSVIQELPIHKYFSNIADKAAFEKRQDDIGLYATVLESLNPTINDHFGAIAIHEGCWVNGPKLLTDWRTYLMERDMLMDEHFDYDSLVVASNKVMYKSIEAGKLIFCEGAAIVQNPWFNNISLNPAKGESLIIKMDAMPQDAIVLRGLMLLPIGDGKFYVGSTNEWDSENDLTSEAKRAELVDGVKKITHLPFTVEEHLAGVRPNVKDRRPLIGIHWQYPQLGILNGMGTKGYSLAPWCAIQLIDHLEKDKPIEHEIDYRRYLLKNHK